MPDIVYIFGAGHSGSTLLDVLLSQHPDVQGLGEVHRLSLDPSTRLCGCGSPLLQCSYWRPIIDEYALRLGGGGVVDDVNIPPMTILRSQAGPLSARTLEALVVVGSRSLVSALARFSPWVKGYIQVVRNSECLYEIIAERHASKVVIDSTKNPLRGKMTWLFARQPITAVNLVRDGRAVAASMMRRDGVSMNVAATHWKVTCLKVEAALMTIPQARRHFIRYEDLCRNPVCELNAVFAVAGLSPIAESFVGRDISEHHEIPGNPVLQTGIHRVALDEKWRTSLSAVDLAEFERVAGALNRRYGYEALS